MNPIEITLTHQLVQYSSIYIYIYIIILHQDHPTYLSVVANGSVLFVTDVVLAGNKGHFSRLFPQS